MSSEKSNQIANILTAWKNSLMESIPIGGLISRNPTAYKWKALYRSWVLREAAFWRFHELMDQSYTPFQRDQILGARILLRSGLETFALLVYLNQSIRLVLDEKQDFFRWGDKTEILLIGSRNNSKRPKPVNILNMIDISNKRYPGLSDTYASLSESTHPNYEGMMQGYSKTDYEVLETKFSSRWKEIHSGGHLELMRICMEVFHYEYDQNWVDLMEKLEIWVVENDEALETAKKLKNNNEQE